MIKPAIAFYLQHYLTPSMTFIYRQLKGVENTFNPFVLCSNKLENLDLFPYGNIYHKRRNLIYFKESRIFSKIYGYHTILSSKPQISNRQNKFFKKVLLNNEVKLIHAHFGPAAIEILPLVQKLNLPLIVTFHGYDASSLLRYEVYKRSLLPLFKYSRIITVSEFMKDVLIQNGADSDKINIVRCGIPVDKFQFIEREAANKKYNNQRKIKFLQISNFVQKKGHEYTIEAINRVINYYSNIQLILAGSGPLLNEIRQLVKIREIDSKVIFTGKVDEEQVLKLMKDADIFLHHSITTESGEQEGIPTVIMEAMATGLPVVSTHHAGIPELIKDGVNGFLVEERNIEEYVKRIVDIVEKENEFPKASRETIERNFNLEKEVKKMIEIYSKHLISSEIHC
ncbi:MAG: glycosyltransferase [Promethearchaeota archaeon]|jgi:glycosyltransferase involved in cell wall biosynthesis